MPQHIYRSDRTSDKLFWGLILIGMGVWFLLSMYGIVPGPLLHAWWPVLILAAGLGTLITARSPKAIGSGVSTLGIGTWMLIAANDWYGLGWYRSWPLALVAAGLGMVTRALAQAVWPREKEDEHVQ